MSCEKCGKYQVWVAESHTHPLVTDYKGGIHPLAKKYLDCLLETAPIASQMMSLITANFKLIGIRPSQVQQYVLRKRVKSKLHSNKISDVEHTFQHTISSRSCVPFDSNKRPIIGSSSEIFHFKVCFTSKKLLALLANSWAAWTRLTRILLQAIIELL